ncbi:MAG: SPOR domain-containing protein [Bacteroidia bacterium]|jgi:hypothetical protein|nr:SPOR domain-containing protein [Bacteroidia bacterium]
MKNLLLIACCGFCYLMPGIALAQLTQEEEKFWKEKAKMYVKNPRSLAAEFENYQDQIQELKNMNKDLSTKLAAAQNSDLVDSLRWALIQAEGEIKSIKAQKDKLERAYKSQKTAGDQGIKTGLVYRVQIGAYVLHQMNNAPKSGDDFVEEKADGFNKYVIGGFRTVEEANGFRDELRKMGMKDAWVVPYIDGVRVSQEEATRYLEKQAETARVSN